MNKVPYISDNVVYVDNVNTDGIIPSVRIWIETSYINWGFIWDRGLLRTLFAAFVRSWILAD